MTELERDLRDLGSVLDLPGTPSLAARVRPRLAEPPRTRRRWRVVALALAVLALAVGAAFAVPQSRGAILRWLGLRGVRIEFVQRLPRTQPRAPLNLGDRLSLSEAHTHAGFRILVSDLLGDPDEVRFDGRQVWLLYRRSGRLRVLVSEFRGQVSPAVFKKVVAPTTRVAFVSVGDEPGYWISGSPHFLYLAPTGQVREERIRVARNALVWQHGLLTVRLEGSLKKTEALRIARSLR